MSRLSRDHHNLLSEDVLNMLFTKNIYTVRDYLRAENKYIERISSLTFPEINAVKKHLIKSFSVPTVNAFHCYQKMLVHSALIPTGIESIDKILNGGIMTGNIYEICGPPSSGKTLFVINILKAFLRSDNSPYFLDSRQKLSAKSLKITLSNEFKDNYLSQMNRILIKRIHNKYELISALYDIKNELDSQIISVRVIIIDSLPTLLLTSADSTENNNILNHLANILRYLANERHIAIVVTNLVTTWVEGDITAINYVQERIGCGKYWRNIPNYRIKLHKQPPDNVEVDLVKCNVIQHHKKCTLKINDFIYT